MSRRTLATDAGRLLRLLRKFEDVPHVVAGRLAAMAHGLPIRVTRIDLLVAHHDRPRFAEAIRRCSVLRWNERWQEFRDYLPAERPGPMRWLISDSWELRATLVDQLPGSVLTRLGEWELRVPPWPWLATTDPDVAELADRLRELGWDRPAGSPAGA